MLRGRSTHEAMAGALGAGAVLTGAVAGPLGAVAIDLASALATAGIAAHAVAGVARERGIPANRTLSATAHAMTKGAGASLAADAVEVLCHARSADARVLRAFAILLGKAATLHARGLVLQLFGRWGAPFRVASTLLAPVDAARAALDGADLVRAFTDAVPAARPVADACPPESGRFPAGAYTPFDDSFEETPNLKEAA